ncbi:cysteine-rich CWC family protein [Aliivibrio kagoshimensis]
MANQDTPCWCARTTIPEALIEQVPKELKNRACICTKCVEAFKAKSVHFVSPKQ